TYQVREQNGYVTAFRADGRIDYVQDTTGNRITAGYTGSQLVSLTHSSGPSLQFAYNAAGRLVTVTDSAGRVTAYAYDATNEHLLSVKGFDGRTVSYTYDTSTGTATSHALLSVTNGDGTHHYYTYDSQGRLSTSQRDGGAEPLTFAYGPGGMVSITDATGATGRVFFNDRGLIARTEDPLGHASYFTFDTNSNLVQV